MQKYKLINLQTKKEHLCDKITIDGFDYYVSDEAILEFDYYEYNGQIGQRIRKNPLAEYPYPEYKKVIACNNPDIDIPKVVVAAVRLAEEHCEWWEFERILGSGSNTLAHDSFVFGYNKSQESHPNSDEDMIEFTEWYINVFLDDILGLNGKEKMNKYKHLKNQGVTKEIIQLWKEQRPKIIYYA